MRRTSGSRPHLQVDRENDRNGKFDSSSDLLSLVIDLITAWLTAVISILGCDVIIIKYEIGLLLNYFTGMQQTAGHCFCNL